MESIGEGGVGTVEVLVRGRVEKEHFEKANRLKTNAGPIGNPF